jgi:hypothetical protein
VEPVVIGEGDTLLAVIHGVGDAGWRHPEARQAYLLKVPLRGALKVQKRDNLVNNVMAKTLRLPHLFGDVIVDEGVGHRFLYWTNADYRWFTLKGRDLAKLQ